MKRHRVAGVAIAALAGFLCAGPAFGIGVLAVNSDTGGWGMAWDYGDLAEARKAALEECGEGCEIVGDFENSCAAYVSSHTEDGFVVVWGGGDSEVDAKTEALEECLRETTGRCAVEIAVCDSGDSERSISNADEADAAPGSPAPGRVFRDCPNCPEMVVIPAGTFRMGCVSGLDCQPYSNEAPKHTVTISQPFAMSKHEVTFAQWDACVAAGGCGGYSPRDDGWGRGNRPVIYVSEQDAQAYVSWLSRVTSERYRLPSESEWEYAARAGSETTYSWGNEIGSNRANCDGCGSRWDDEMTAPVGSFSPNMFGLHDMHGNVWEWVEDCWNDRYEGAPSDGSAWLTGFCGSRVWRGGSWYNYSWSVRSAHRAPASTGSRNYGAGFRVVRTLVP